MKLMMELEEGEQESPIKLAEAIINIFESRYKILPYCTDEDVQYQMNQLDAVADHIKVYLAHKG